MLPLFLGYSNPTFQEMVAKLHKTQGQPGGSHPWVIGEVLSPISKQTACTNPPIIRPSVFRGFLKWWVSQQFPWVFLLKMIILGCDMGDTTIYGNTLLNPINRIFWWPKKKNTWDPVGSFGKPTLTLWFFVPSWWALPMSVETTNDQVRWEELQFAEKRWELFILKNESNPSIWKRTENFYSFWSPSWARWIMKKT